MDKKMNGLSIASWILCTIAALQLGIWATFGYDVLGLLGSLTRWVDILIGLGGLVSVWGMFMMSKK